MNLLQFREYFKSMESTLFLVPYKSRPKFIQQKAKFNTQYTRQQVYIVYKMALLEVQLI